MSDFSFPLGNTVRAARNKRGLTQNDVADLIGVDARTILNIENFKGNPKMEVLFTLIRALEIDPTDVFYPEITQDAPMRAKLILLISSCTEQEIEALIPIVNSVLSVLRTQNTTEIK